MVTLNLPPCEAPIRRRADQTTIFDVVRKKYVVLTPEEWVRQHFVHYLIHTLGYPRSLMRVESGLHYNRMARRSDIVVHRRDGTPWMVVECKAPKVSLSPSVFEQVAVYNQSLRAVYAVVTNGLVHYCCRMDYQAGTYGFLDELPKFG